MPVDVFYANLDSQPRRPTQADAVHALRSITLESSRLGLKNGLPSHSDPAIIIVSGASKQKRVEDQKYILTFGRVHGMRQIASMPPITRML